MIKVGLSEIDSDYFSITRCFLALGAFYTLFQIDIVLECQLGEGAIDKNAYVVISNKILKSIITLLS